jgi:phage FluMu gp28-like protein
MWQAVLMAEQLTAGGIRCHPLSFNVKNLDLMARDLLEVFQNRWIRLFRDEALLADLYRLNVIERPQGFRLDAKRDKTGHADRATALAMAIPSALVWSLEMAEHRDQGDTSETRYTRI